MTTYILTGNTYPHRAFLRQRGAQWDFDARAWEINIGGNGADRFLRELRAKGIVTNAV